MIIDIKAIREAALDAETDGHIGSVVIALCDEVESLRNGMFNIAYQSTEPAIQEFARSYLEAKQ